MNEHDYCRLELAELRREARDVGVPVPANLTAIRQTHNQFFVQGDHDAGRTVKADCAWSAKARLIAQLVQAARAKGEEAEK